MKKTISIQCSSLLISWWRMILVFGVLLFAFQTTLHAQIERGSFDFDGRLRNYMVYLPTKYTGSTNFPLVIYLHSYGTTAQQEMDYTQLNQVADASDFIVVYPSAIPNWNSDVLNIPRFPNPDVDDVGFINALIDILSNNYSIDLEKIYACGYSNGGAMAFRLAFQLSDRIAAIASVSGPVSPSVAEAYKLVRPMPVLYIHGTSDTIVPINGNSDFPSAEQTLSIWTNFNECFQTETTILPDLDQTDGCTVEKISYINCSDNCNVLYYKVIGGGHTWPGARSGYAPGNTNQDIDASVEIWNFFNNHKLVVHPVLDFNGDGIVDSLDMCIMIDHWGENYSLCDIGPLPRSDGIVDIHDLIIFAENMYGYFQPVAHWTLNETAGDTAYDKVGNNDASVYGDALWQPSAGKVGGALMFDGIDDYVGTTFILNPGKTSFSVTAWIRGGATGQVVISQADVEGQSAIESGGTWLGISQSDGRLMTGLMDIFFGPLESESVVADEQWHHVGLVYDFAAMKRHLYADGAEVAVDAGIVAGVQSTAGFYIGSGQTLDAGTFYSGLIDDVRVYNVALNTEQITALAQ